MKLLPYFALILLFISCKNQQETSEQIPQNKTLKTVFKDDFYVGVALNEAQIKETDSVTTNLIAEQFSSVTPENLMKSMHIYPEKEVFNFTTSDVFVNFAKKHQLHIQGHTLIWHSQLSPFFSEITDSTELASVITNHINTIIGRYKGKIDAWDVLNEALNDDGALRESVFYKVLGEDYIPMVFQIASEADPNAQLFYNDYSLTNPDKRRGAINLIKNLQNKGVKVDGIGMQGHWGLTSPTISEIETSILEYAALGIKVDITELDISVIPMPWDFSGADVNVKFESDDPTMNPYPTELPEVIQKQLAIRYQEIFKLLSIKTR
nr:endo-1,4-beta-xylanase [Tamlana nanhaiensis]